ncbi:AGAP012544-PA [Anopheles gambiae str. PEST]|uniref:AGAP012544-PA n=1 Tax=Anopheles gambiae TaxID=7165 RepID=Q7QKT2_ANOGA|nr:AGAP012544-PA [Anopheles gambiae str. PEST]
MDATIINNNHSSLEAMDSTLQLTLHSYNMAHPKRGIAVVINNNRDRKGSEKDVKALQAVLSHLQFDVRLLSDKTTVEIRHALKEVSKEDHTNNDCLAIIAMAHGYNDRIKFDDDYLHIDELWTNFVGNKCPSLIGKPKLVFIQSCRGGKLDYGASIATADARPGLEEPVDVKIPMYADLLVMYSSFEHHSSIRCRNEGSWFIQSFCQVLGANIAKTELQALLCHVSYLVSIRSDQTIDPEGKVVKQIPMVTSMLTKAFYFVPK